ncbi:MAG: hypothetical protein LBL51_00200 [Synergistaceae bacterium]|jgi:hypothetical protein|nr:hypothetical protein [Synergistaceae bacterium]
MKRGFLPFSSKWGGLLCLALGMSLSAVPEASARGTLYLAEPLLVAQPSYAGMRFYVYKPYNAPKGWYATFDGYPVVKNKDGIWVYGTYSGPNLVPTNYIVGSVIPSMAGLSPYTGTVQISSVTSVPGHSRVQGPRIEVRQPGAASVPVGAESTYLPDWLFDGRFVALGRWKGSVDRVGLLSHPSAPVAWKGNYPKVIYVWTGRVWYQMTVREGQRPADALREGMYRLTRALKRDGLVWYEADVPVLAEQAAVWGYYWMGELALRDLR